MFPQNGKLFGKLFGMSTVVQYLYIYNNKFNSRFVNFRENVPCGTLIMMKGNVKETRDIKDTKDTSNTNDTKKTKYIKPTKYISYTDSSDCGDPIEIVEDDW